MEVPISEPTLHRRVTLPLLTLYGLGTMVGGGFYALIGKVGALAGDHTPFAFVLSGIVAAFSALSFGELASRYPSSAGESRYVLEAFGSRALSTAVGWLVIATGVVSAATLSNAFALFLQDLLPVPTAVGVVAVVVALGAVSAYGIGESVAISVAITVVEVGGLLAVLWIQRSAFTDLPATLPGLLPPTSMEGWSGVLLATFLAFYAYVGFEDMVNLAEEVTDVRRTLPWAIVLSLAATTVLYVLVSLVARVVVSPEALVEAHTPLALLVGDDGPVGRVAITVISMFAGVNGALMQVVMASRVAYGMGDRGLAPGWLGVIHGWTRTPVNATVAASLVVLVLALAVPLVSLAKLTSAILLGVFVLVNASLVVIQQRGDPAPEGAFLLPRFVPPLGALLSGALLGVQLWSLVR